jgi:serpin B
VAGSNAFAFKCLSELYNADPGSMVFSPLSLQYALAMTVNGASGETAAEITKALGFNADMEALNAYCNLLLNQLPALDPQVDVRLADALVVDKGYPLLPSFKETVEGMYYAPVEYMSFSDRKAVVDRINEWAHRNTNGLIFPFLKESDLNESTIATILNALYFKAPWYNPHGSALFLPEATLEDAEFFLDGGGKAKADLMQTSGYFGYSERNGYRIVEIPYAGGKFAMYVLLPDKSGGNGLKNLMAGLAKESWEEMTKSLTYSTKVNLRFPRFETASRFALLPALKALGISKAFGGGASFDRMFDGKGSFFIGNVIQKAKIKVTEWGTEAAAVTVVMLDGASGIVPKTVDFFADHPFAYVIAEKSSGTILFEGVFTGE